MINKEERKRLQGMVLIGLKFEFGQTFFLNISCTLGENEKLGGALDYNHCAALLIYLTGLSLDKSP